MAVKNKAFVGDYITEDEHRQDACTTDACAINCITKQLGTGQDQK